MIRWLEKPVKKSDCSLLYNGTKFCCPFCGFYWGYGCTRFCPECGKRLADSVKSEDKDRERNRKNYPHSNGWRLSECEVNARKIEAEQNLRMKLFVHATRPQKGTQD